MAKVYKDIYINWTWGGDEKLLKGFNVALTTSGGNPNRDSIIIQKTNNKKTDILNKGTEQYEHIFRNVMMNDTEEHVAWVQALTDGYDSEWISTTNMVINDDGTATIETTDGAKNKANNAETNAKSYTDDEITNLDDALTNDINALGTEIDNMSSDSKITRAEANVLEQRLNELKKEDDNLISVATTLGISSTAYTNSINTLDTYLSSYIGQTNYPIDIADRATMKSSFEAVQNEKTALINAITDKRADNAKAEAMSYTDSEITTLNNNLSDDIDNLGSTISDMSADNKITRAEANVLEQRLNEVKAEDNNFISVASGLGLSTTNYSNAINALETYLSSYINQTSYPINITDRATMKTKFDDVQTAKTALINSITETMAINAEANAKDYTDTLETSLGNLAFDNLVEKAKLDSTIIDGGYIKSYLLTADNILTGRLGANRVQIGGGTTYESGYDPTTKETPSGAQSKADTAEGNAKKYADDESKWVSTNHRIEANIGGPGWVRIASNPGDRAHATFKIIDTNSGRHNSLEFKLGCSYNQRGNADFQMVSFSRYSILSISGVRLLTNGTYDPMYVEVFFTGATSGVRCDITDNIQSNGWNPVEFDNGVIPAGYASTEWDVDVNSITMDGRGIRTTGSDGDYSILSDDSLLFYENGSNIPHDYSKRVASGIAQNGDYISLGWDKDPKVTTAIKQLRSYTGSYSNRNQTYSCYHSAPSASGFYVYGRSVVLGGTTKNTINTNISASSTRLGSECYGYTYTPGSADWVWPGSTVNGSTYLRVRFNVTSSSSNNVLRFYYKRTTSSSWIYHKGYTNPSTGVRDIAMNLAAGEYHFRFNISCSTGSLSINVVECEYRASDLNIATGEVMWLAIEGGSD